ncbi:MAG: hypothetical protein JXR33_09155 [Coriobacteriia bacterium]|nr:hypothetical protein [Coriobacteriia bacterium]
MKIRKAILAIALGAAMVLTTVSPAFAHGGGGGEPGWGWQDAPGVVSPGAPWSGR